MMWRDLVLESGAGLSNAAKCRLRKSEWTLLAFADGSKLFVATRDLSPTIFHFKEKWKQLFDLGILGGATGRGRERGGDRSGGEGREVRAIKIRAATMEGWGRGRGGGREQEACQRGWGRASACVRVHVSLSVSLHTDSDHGLVGTLCVCLIPGQLEEAGEGRREREEEGGEGHPARPLAGSTPSSVGEGAGGPCRRRV